TVTVETLGGIKVLHLNIDGGAVSSVRVDMGEPVFNCTDIPVDTDKPVFVNQGVDTPFGEYRLTCVSMGNPHAVTFVDSVDDVQIDKIGPALENHPLFPKRANIEFVQRVSPGILKMRVWERGTGETLACGTGACASLVAAVLGGVSGRKVKMLLLGGELELEWNEDDNHIYMTGPAQFVFDGELL
ncbi:MAG: diaminopimelate epimerase, partial [Oscillospiraceae bacterium]|nr:diaminopimelate epimerase [Oscillospiraceae bacterium]